MIFLEFETAFSIWDSSFESEALASDSVFVFALMSAAELLSALLSASSLSSLPHFSNVSLNLEMTTPVLFENLFD